MGAIFLSSTRRRLFFEKTLVKQRREKLMEKVSLLRGRNYLNECLDGGSMVENWGLKRCWVNGNIIMCIL